MLGGWTEIFIKTDHNLFVCLYKSNGSSSRILKRDLTLKPSIIKLCIKKEKTHQNAESLLKLNTQRKIEKNRQVLL